MSRFKGEAPKKKKAKIVIWSLVLLLLFGTGILFAVIYHSLDKTVDQMDYEETHDVEWDIDPDVSESLSGYRNILILGVDARSMTNYDGSRSDAILVLSLDKETGSINMISLMRDSYLEIYTRTGDLHLDKITNAHASGGGVAACRALNRNLDLNIREYAVFNWKAVADVVDAFGGVQVEVKENELHDLNIYGDETGSYIGRPFTPVLTAGVQTLDGVQAASYCRIRKTSGGDSQRAERMKKVLEAIFTQAKSMNLSELKAISENALPEIRTNMGSKAILTMLMELGTYNLNKNIGLPYEYDGGMFHGGWYAVPRTLESNVIQLHAEAFAQAEYVPSDTALGISQKIIDDTGVVPLE